MVSSADRELLKSEWGLGKGTRTGAKVPHLVEIAIFAEAPAQHDPEVCGSFQSMFFQDTC
jgi:hypothetical protein